MRYRSLVVVCAAPLVFSSPTEAVTATISSACQNAIEAAQPQMSKASQDLHAAEAAGNQVGACSAMHELDPALAMIARNCNASEIELAIGGMLDSWRTGEAAICKPSPVMLTPRQPLRSPATRKRLYH